MDYDLHEMSTNFIVDETRSFAPVYRDSKYQMIKQTSTKVPCGDNRGPTSIRSWKRVTMPFLQWLVSLILILVAATVQTPATASADQVAAKRQPNQQPGTQRAPAAQLLGTWRGGWSTDVVDVQGGGNGRPGGGVEGAGRCNYKIQTVYELKLTATDSAAAVVSGTFRSAWTSTAGWYNPGAETSKSAKEFEEECPRDWHPPRDGLITGSAVVHLDPTGALGGRYKAECEGNGNSCYGASGCTTRGDLTFMEIPGGFKCPSLLDTKVDMRADGQLKYVVRDYSTHERVVLLSNGQLEYTDLSGYSVRLSRVSAEALSAESQHAAETDEKVGDRAMAEAIRNAGCARVNCIHSYTQDEAAKIIDASRSGCRGAKRKWQEALKETQSPELIERLKLKLRRDATFRCDFRNGINCVAGDAAEDVSIGTDGDSMTFPGFHCSATEPQPGKDDDPFATDIID
jgi:hypothetical protein